MLKPSLQLKLGQTLTMTPQLQQAIRLLQLPVLDLNAQIQEALEENIMLEMEDLPDVPSTSAETTVTTATISHCSRLALVRRAGAGSRLWDMKPPVRPTGATTRQSPP